jgi:hypothetical protein
MGRVKRGGYIFVTWKGDHSPYHVHIYKDGSEVLKFNLEAMVPIEGEVTKRLMKLILSLIKERLL